MNLEKYGFDQQSEKQNEHILAEGERSVGEQNCTLQIVFWNAIMLV